MLAEKTWTDQKQKKKKKLALARENFLFVEKQTTPSYKTGGMVKTTRKIGFWSCNLQTPKTYNQPSVLE